MVDESEFNKQPTHPKLTAEKRHSPSYKIPEKIGPYKVEALLDKGGMSYLYLGSHPDTKEPLAIKVLSQKYISNPEVVQRFLNESEIISMTNHPNIVKMYGHGEWEGGLYIAMEYIEGVSLRKYILKNPISLKRALSIIIDIAYALCHLHTHGVIHRDLKPENILVTENSAIKVIDFGIAQLLTEKITPDQPPKQRLVGTPIYISPEQKENPETVSFPTDIYSLGIISYELILGKLSHGHIHISLLPTGMQPILHRCLQPNPEDRYQDIVDFITDVSTYLNSPALQKERQVGDRLSEFTEELKKMQSKIVPPTPPNWPNVEIGISCFKDFTGTEIYYDFFKLSDKTYGIFIGESSTKAAESFVTIGCLRGMIKVLYRLTKKPAELVTVLNDLLINDQIGSILNLNYIVLDPEENLMTYVSLGYGNLWYVSRDGKPPINCSPNQLKAGVNPKAEIFESSLPWNSGDVIVLNTLSSYDSEKRVSLKFNEEAFIKELQNNLSSPPQKQVDNMLRKLRMTASDLFKERMLTLISIKRL